MAEDPNVGTAYVSLIPSAKGFGPAVSQAIGGPVEKEAAAAGIAGGSSLQKGLLGKTLGTGPKLLKNLGIIAVGAEAFHAAHAVEDANNIIIRSTGASGKAAEGLEASFKRVAGNTPASFETVATALSQVYQRTGLTGKGLEDLTLKVVTFNRITKDSPVDVRELTKTLAGFNIPAGKMSGSLDQLYVISQKTGVPLADLVSQLGQAGPIARQFGFSMNFTAGFLAQLNKAGIDGSSIMPGLRKAFIAFAKEGKSPAKGLRETLGAIDALIKKGNITGAQQIAVKLFGARGVGLVDAAVQGKISLQSLTKTFAPMGDGILKTAAKTSTLGGQFGKLRNVADLALSSLAKPILTGAIGAMKFILPIVKGLAAAFEHLPGPIKSVLVGIIAVALLAGPIKKFGSAIGGAFKAISGVGKLFAANPMLLWIAGIAIVVVLIIKFRKQILGALKVIGRAFVIAGKVVGRFFTGIGKWLFKAGKAIVGFFTSLPGRVLGLAKRFWPIIVGALFPGAILPILLIKFWGPISRFFGSLGSKILQLLVGAVSWLYNVGRDIITGLWKGLVAYVKLVFKFWTSLPGWILGLLVKAATWLYDIGKAIITGLWKGLVAYVTLVFKFWTALPGLILRLLARAGTWLFNVGKSILVGLLHGIIAAAGAVWNFYKGMGAFIRKLLVGAGTWLYNIGKAIITGLFNGIKFIVGAVWTFFKNVPGFIVNFFKNAGKWLFNAGKAIVQGLIDGMKALVHGAGGLLSFVGGLGSKIISLKGPIDKDRVMLVPAGQAIMHGLIVGLKGEEDRLVKLLGQITGHFTALNGQQITAPTAARTLSLARAAVPALAAHSARGAGEIRQEITVNYPKPERASTALPVAMRHLKIMARRS